MNAACSKFKAVALNVRVYGYQNCGEEELDSFLIFIANTTLRVSVCIESNYPFTLSLSPHYKNHVTIYTDVLLIQIY